MMIEIFGSLPSRATRAIWAAEECGAEYTFQRLNLRAGEHLADEFLALNPNGRVPAMRDGELKLFESAAICIYLGEQHPEKNLLPKRGTHEAAFFDQWMFWTTTELEQALWTMGKHRFALPKKYRVEEMKDVARYEYDRAIAILPPLLGEREFIVGDHFTMADVMLTHTLEWARLFGLPFPSENLTRYADLHLARPGYKATLALA